MSPQITLLHKGGTNAILSKRIYLDNDGFVRSDSSQCLMTEGTATRVLAATAGALAGCIAECASNQAITLGALKEGIAETAQITVPRKKNGNPAAITRSRGFIDYRPGEPGWALIDFDQKGMPPPVAANVGAAGSMWNALLAVAPGLARAARVSRSSTSAGLLRTDTGERIAGSGGTHHYILVKDAGDIERFLHDLHDRCWLNGLGWHLIGSAGQLLDRSVVDPMVAYGERLCFEGAPIIEPPLAQDATKRLPDVFEGDPIDTSVIVPRLTEYERHLVSDAKAASARVLDKPAADVRSKHDRLLAEKISAKSGVPIISAQRLVAARHRGVLLPCVELDFDQTGIVPVADVLADPDRFVGETLADPLEGAEYGRAKAMVMRSDDGGLFIHSFAHGRGLYLLRHDARSAKAAIASTPADAVVDFAMAILATSDMEADEIADFAATVAAAAKIGVRAVMARIVKERRDREKAERRRVAASSADGRIIRPRPEPDGELTPTVTFLDQLLAADHSEEPPMRDASGSLVEVRVREPWSLHLLTADGTNAKADDAQTMKPPAEPGLLRLTPTSVELMIERYVRWLALKRNTTYFAALPRTFIEALMQYSPSVIPVARAINTAPLVSMSANIIDGVGLDRTTGLVHRIDPLLRACVPSTAPTEQDARNAIRFLLNEWLIDVTLDPVGKCVAILLALTLIERPLLPERPAWFVTAGQRGGGKTTLVNMITLAALGRRAAAASWSDNPEERKKALFSYLRQGVAGLAWDNIARGSTISCPHIEAALTAPEISDRVLGVSKVETAPAVTVQIFTGNSIMPRGDMASRSLVLPLKVDRPDPENRPFTHADPLAWTQAHRPKIVRAFYTLLIAGALNRPSDQTAKSRFKTWWSLVGWPVEYAASLIGVKVDCTELLRGGEAGDEEASAASTALTVLHSLWGSSCFTTRDVVRVLTPEPKSDGTGFYPKISDADKARADGLADALGELIGKRLDKPTAHSIGKLFQKRLVGRPAWIGDEQVVAVLRRTPGHSENGYHIDLSRAISQTRIDQTNYASPPTVDGEEHSPLSPHSPGKEGNVGNVSIAHGGTDANCRKSRLYDENCC